MYIPGLNSELANINERSDDCTAEWTGTIPATQAQANIDLIHQSMKLYCLFPYYRGELMGIV